MLRPLARAIAALLAVAALDCGAAVAALAAPSRAPGSRSATPLLVTRAQLGRGWTVSSPAPHPVPSIACGLLHIRHAATAGVLSAASPTFADGADGPFLDQTAYVYPTAAQAAAVWRVVVRRALLGCLARSFARGGRHGVTFKVTERRLERAPRIGAGATAALLSLRATASGAGQSDQAFLDVLLVRRGAAIDELSFTSLLEAPPRSLELRLGRAAGRRLKDALRLIDGT